VPRVMVGLLAAVAATMSAVAALAHGELMWLAIAACAAAAGLAAYVTAPQPVLLIKKLCDVHDRPVQDGHKVNVVVARQAPGIPAVMVPWRRRTDRRRTEVRSGLVRPPDRCRGLAGVESAWGAVPGLLLVRFPGRSPNPACPFPGTGL
jgi:hypothetical protein